MIRQLVLACIIALCVTAGPLLAKPPPGATANSLWFESLEDPETTLSCCDEADCRVVDDRIAGDHYEVLVRGAWIAVPAGKMLHRTDNPTGRAVLCWSPAFGIMCFVPGLGV
jgi:hypothetical protein